MARNAGVQGAGGDVGRDVGRDVGGDTGGGDGGDGRPAGGGLRRAAMWIAIAVVLVAGVALYFGYERAVVPLAGGAR